MAQFFKGRWRGTVVARNADYGQRVVVSGATGGNGAYNGVVGNSFEFSDGQAELQWNNNEGSGWQPSGIISSIGLSTPFVVKQTVSADDDFPNRRDGDFDDLVVTFEYLDPPFAVDQRPFALERDSRVMLPDGIFDASQGVQYMGVRIRNTWFFDWTSGPGLASGVKIGIGSAARSALAARGVIVRDDWSAAEQQAFGQVVENGYVRVPDLDVGESTTVYFKVDATNASPSKPDVGFIAQRDLYDPHAEAPSRVSKKQVFISRSSFDPISKELVCEVPEGRMRVRFSSIVLDRKAANDAAKALIRCLGSKGSRRGESLHAMLRSWWQNHASPSECRRQTGAVLREMLRQLEAGRDVDLCRLKDLLEACCKPETCNCNCDGGGNDNGGWSEGTGLDGWCRVRPVGWLPLAFDYSIEPNPPYAGQHGPLAFEDPWWKVVLIILAVLLEIASLVYDYVSAGQDPQFIIGKILRNGDATANAIDCAVASLNGSRGVDLGEQDAQNDDSNNGLPIEGLGNIIQLDRTDNGSFGVQPATVGNVAWKSGGRSGTTRGFVKSVTYATNVPYETEDTISGTITYTNQVLINQIVGMEQPVSQAGDSGSAWIDMASKRPIALNFAGDVKDEGVTGVGNPILDVVNRLDIRFNS